MRLTYQDLVEQTFGFPNEDFKVKDNELMFKNLPVMELVKKYGTPLRFTYLPQVATNIQLAKKWFKSAFESCGYKGNYTYCYCTKSSHFAHILTEVLNNDAHIETSSAFDIDIVESLYDKGELDKNHFIICNGFKRDEYIKNIARLINNGFKNCIPIIDNYEELPLLQSEVDGTIKIGIRIASEEEPKFEFYTSRLGIGYKNIIEYYNTEVANNSQVELKMLHFFINTGIADSSYYWSELRKCLKVYTNLKKICPSLNSLNIGGGFPVKDTLAFEYDYEKIVGQIVLLIKTTCDEEGVPEPDLFTEFGTFTVGESGGLLYKVLYQKQQNNREKWNLIDSSFMTTLPDTWSINKRFIMLPLNHWQKEYEKVLLGGLTCDSDDYYNTEKHNNAIYMPAYDAEKPLYIGFFNTGAYQESIGGYGGLQHCLIPQPKHIIINKDERGELITHVFSEQQKGQDFLKILGYGK